MKRGGSASGYLVSCMVVPNHEGMIPVRVLRVHKKQPKDRGGYSGIRKNDSCMQWTLSQYGCGMCDHGRGLYCRGVKKLIDFPLKKTGCPGRHKKTSEKTQQRDAERLIIKSRTLFGIVSARKGIPGSQYMRFGE